MVPSTFIFLVKEKNIYVLLFLIYFLFLTTGLFYLGLFSVCLFFSHNPAKISFLGRLVCESRAPESIMLLIWCLYQRSPCVFHCNMVSKDDGECLSFIYFYLQELSFNEVSLNFADILGLLFLKYQNVIGCKRGKLLLTSVINLQRVVPTLKARISRYRILYWVEVSIK